mgnify:CR=1 FL=1
MSKNKRIIAWEKWDEDVLEQEVVEEIYTEVSEEEEDLVEEALLFMEKIPKLITTPMGMYQLHDKMSILNQFDCWMGYTNFDITTAVQSEIEKAEGVELLTIAGRYRFFLGVGKLFEFPQVRQDIEDKLCGARFVIDDDMQETVDTVRDVLSQDKYWAIFVQPTGEILYASTNDEDDEKYFHTLMSYEKQKKKLGGRIFQSE